MRQKALVLLLAILVAQVVNAAREINNLLVNDLNIIANKLDDIPETNLNIKFVLMALECNDVRLTWKLNNNNLRNSNELNFYAKNKNPGASVTIVQPPKIFGYQIVVRETLEPTAASMSQEIMNQFNSDKTTRVYSSKFIYPTQSKFKLINLLRKNTASYHICLVIYIDVTETVAFEKQCINFSLPNVPAHMEAACKSKNGSKKGQTTVMPVTRPRASKPSPSTNMIEAADSVASLSSTTPLDYFSAFEEKLEAEQRKNKPNSTKAFNLNRNELFQNRPINSRNKQTKQGSSNAEQFGKSNRKSEAQFNSSNAQPKTMSPSAVPASDIYQCENSSQCRNYSNLLIAFVVCGILLATNVFMFTLIIIQNTIKLGLLRQKVKAIKNYYKKKGNYLSYQVQYLESGDKTFLNSEQDLALEGTRGCCESLELKKAFQESCADIFKAICCGALFRSAKKSSKKQDEKEYGSTTELRLDSELNPSCTTITRPGYILQVPSSVGTSLNVSPKKSFFSSKNSSPTSSSNLFAKSSLLNSKFKPDLNKPFVPSHYMPSGFGHSNTNNAYNNNYTTYSHPRHYESHGPGKGQFVGYTNYQLQQQQHSDDSSTTVSCLDRNEMGNYDNEVFYHMPKGMGSAQISSAF